MRTTKESMLNAVITEITSNPDIINRVSSVYEQTLQLKYGYLPKQIIEINVGGVTVSSTTEVTHEKFTDIVSAVANNIPVFLVGNAGLGKNHTCKQVSDALDLDFYFTNAITDEYKLTGFKDASGKYHETPFYQAFVNGGLFFFDEVDASVPETLVLVNAAIENRYFNFPCGMCYAHPKFRVIAAGNTFGKGATSTFVGRYKLDAASLDRFITVYMDYDRNVELYIANGDENLVESIHRFRDAAYNSNILTIVSYRAIRVIKNLVENTDIDPVDIIKYTLIKGMGIDDVKLLHEQFIKGGIGPENKYNLMINAALMDTIKNYNDI